MTQTCIWHLCTTPLSGRRTKFCSTNCKNKYYVNRRRKTLKEKAVSYKGGKCEQCGYSRCIAALEFHHTNGEKDFGISAKGITRSWAKVQEELDKCICLCSNCHRELHHSGEVFPEFE